MSFYLLEHDELIQSADISDHMNTVSAGVQLGSSSLPVMARANGREHVVSVMIGNPSQPVDLIIDTASCEFWTLSTLLPKNETALLDRSASTNKMFDPSQSRTFQKSDNSHWQVQYYDAHSASGYSGFDQVLYGNVLDKGVAVNVATRASWAKQPDQGVWGLSFPCEWQATFEDGQIKPAVHPIQRLYQKNLIPEPVFTIALSRGKDGTMTLGRPDTSLASSALQYFNLLPGTIEWTVPSSYAVIDGVKIARQGNTASIDSGSSMIFLSDNLLKTIYAKIKGSKLTSDGTWIFPKTSPVPSVALPVGNLLIKIPKSHVAATDTKDGWVIGAFQSRGSFYPQDIFGGAFLKCVVAVFDVGNRRIGLAKRNDVEYEE